MADTVRVEIKGSKELIAAFRGINKDVGREIQIEFKSIADHVVGVTQQRMPFRSGEAARSLKPRATSRGNAGIAYNAGGRENLGAKGGYYPWLDFGGAVGRGKSITRPVVKGGRYLYPSIADSRGVIEDHGYIAVIDVARRHGFDVS